VRLQGRRAIVTGAGGVIGAGIAKALVAEGARVCMVDLRSEAAVRVQQGLGHGETLVHIADVRERGAAEGIVAAVQRAWGGIDILVNNAGLYPSRPILEMPDDEWDRVIDTNLNGPFRLARAVARAMVAQGRGGVIVNMTSGAAESTRRGAAHYSSSKAALAMLTRSLALELGPYGIRSVSVSPGLTLGSEVSPLSTAYTDTLIAGIPLGRAARPEDTAAAVVFACSDEAAFITGSTIKVDGGRSAGGFSLPLSTPGA
jgi:3-oxoacyl-[acyl-carrier protein] reductase